MHFARLLLLALLATTVSPVLAQDSRTASQKNHLRRVDSVEPLEISEGTAGTISLRGRGFVPGLKVYAGATTGEAPQLSPEGVLTARLPASLSPGVHSLRVEWPDGTQLCSRWPLVVRERSCQVAQIPFKKAKDALRGPDAAEEAQTALREALSCLARTGPQTITILGFASREGEDGPNENLSRRRASAVASALRDSLPQLKIMETGLGESLPTNPGEKEDALARNRRALVLSSEARPCQAIRIALNEEGKPSDLSQAVLQSTLQCYANRSVTNVLLVGAESSAGKNQEAQVRALATQIERDIKNTSSKAPATSVQPVFGPPEERAKLAEQYGIPRDPPKGLGSTYVELYPLAWSNAPVVRVTEVDAGCPYEQSLPQEQEAAPLVPVINQEPPHHPDASGFAGVGVGSLFAFDQAHLGAEAYLGTTLARLNEHGSTRLVVKGAVGGYAGGRPYRIAEGFGSRLLSRAVLGLGVDWKSGPWHLGVVAAPGFVLPTARAGLAQGEAFAGWAVSPSAQFTVSASGGAFFFRKAEIEPFALVQLGGGWWF